MQSAGSYNRAAAEFNLLNVENQKRLRTDSTVARARVDEKNARADELDRSIEKKVNTFYQKKSADEAKTAAQLGLVSSIVGAASNIFQGAESGGLTGAITAGLSSVFSVLGAYMALKGAQDEVEMINKQYGYISKDAQSDANAMRALDGNPKL